MVKLQGFPEKKKKIILWTIVAILAIIMGTFWIKGAVDRFSKIEENLGEVKIPEMDFSDMPKIDLQGISDSLNQTNDWKTYINDKYGFEIKYPKDWTYGSSLITIDEPDDIEFCSSSEFAVPDNPSLGCMHYENTNLASDTPRTLASFFLFISSKAIPEQSNLVPEQIVINGINMTIRGQNAYWQENGNFYSFVGNNVENFDQMLSTFKFTK